MSRAACYCIRPIFINTWKQLMLHCNIKQLSNGGDNAGIIVLMNIYRK